MTLILGIVAIFEAVVIVALLVRKETSYSGKMRIVPTPTGMAFSLELEDDPHDFIDASEVKFKVVKDELNARGGNTD